MSRVRACVALSVGLACASAPAPLPEGVSASPAVGDPIGLLLRKLDHASGAPPADLAVEELRVMSVATQPWTRLDPPAAEGTHEPVAVVVGRHCRARHGIHVEESSRASWFLLRDGAVLAYDHDDFGGDCTPLPRYVPTSPADLAIERMLVRYVSQRWPGDGVTPDERLPRGLALLAVGREDDALLELHALDHQLEEFKRRRDEAEDDAESERWASEIARLRPRRAELHHALREAREREGEIQWDG